ncbi:Uncharacterised protein [uncultured archaeon]|nr:Uncharacterised protein [uncultured archaeon]
MACEHYNSKLPICGGVSCDNAYDCQRVSALKEMKAQFSKKPSIETVMESVILFENENIDLNEVKRMAN